MRNVGLFKNLTKVFTLLTIFLSIASCNSDKQSVLDEVTALHPVPQVVSLNTQGGYSINPITGDSILPLISSPGDTVLTGVPVPAKGRVIDPNSVAKPKVIPAGKPKVIRIHQKEHKIPVPTTVIPLDIASLEAFTPGEKPSIFVLINSLGDTIPTGVPIPINGKVVPCKQPQATKALPPIMKDYASSNIKYLDVAQGMSSSHVNSILEDSRGNIWIGTPGHGLSMYNGETFKHFTQKEGLSNNWISSILEDNHGNLWFGTAGGVNMYDGENFTHFTQKEGLSHNNVACILEDSQGNLWFGSWGGGVSKFNGESIIHFTPKEGLSDNYVLSIMEDSHGNFWFGTNGGGVSIYNGKSFVHLSQKQGLINNRVWSILEESQGSIWIGTDDGLCKYDGESLTLYTQNEGLCDNHIRSILKDSRGNLWFGTQGGISMYNGETFTDLTQNDGLSNNRIISILEDSHGNLWFGTEQGGVSISYNNTFTYLTRKEGLRGIYSFFILEDSHGNFWFGSWGGGVNKYNGETMMNFTKKEGLISDIIRCVLEDSQGNIWFGTFEGLCKYDGENFTHFTQNEGLSDNRIRSILEDSHGNLWFGTGDGGVSMYDGTSFTHFTSREGLINDLVNSIIEDISGNLWFATKGGVSMYDGETFTHFTEKEGLSHNDVRSILEGSQGNLWFATNGGGLSMFDGESFTYFTQQEGLDDNYIRSIVEDSDNNIWLSTFNGLIRMEFEQGSDLSTIKIHTYGLQDGLKSLGFVENSAFFDSKKRIWWGSVKGLTILDMNNFTAPVKAPLMQLERIDINRQYIDYRFIDDRNGKKMMFSGVARFYNYPLNLELPYKQNNLSFHFSALDWTAAQKLKYSYVMVGLDDKWSAPTEEAYVEYGNMPFGRYTFKVRALGAAKKWSEPFVYTFRVSPPFWLTWWAYIVYGFALLLLVRWYRGFLIRREKINADFRIKELEVSKMQELDHLKSRFFANISHEFRTPLTLIQGPIEELRKQFKGKPEGSIQLFQTVKRNTQRLMDLINQLLDISKLETGNVKLQVSQGNLVEFVKDLVLSFLSLAEYKKIKYEYDLPEEVRLVYFDPDKIEKIITNLISNAFKFTSEGGKIWVGIQFPESSSTHNSDSVVLKVSDTGKGIPTEKLDKIFKRFYRISDSDNSEVEGTGLGLSLTKELVEVYRGKISVESEPGMGSSFTVNLPVSVAQFREEDIVRNSPVEGLREDHIAWDHEHKNYKDSESIGILIPDTSKDKSLILIVEDNADLRKYICKTLERTYSIICAENGKLGWEKAQESIPDLVISDVMMPEMDGMEMCKRLKSDEISDHIPVIMLTARADRGSKLEGLESGADDYIIKPFDMEELEARIKNLIVQRSKLRKKFRLDFLLAPPEMGLPSMDQFIARLLEIRDQHISDPDFKMSQLSSELNLSQSQVQRKVMAITGYTPNELFRNHRLKIAAKLFRSGHIHVAQVMHHVGFNSQSYFTKCFAELFEMTPSQFIADCKLGEDK